MLVVLLSREILARADRITSMARNLEAVASLAWINEMAEENTTDSEVPAEKVTVLVSNRMRAEARRSRRSL